MVRREVENAAILRDRQKVLRGLRHRPAVVFRCKLFFAVVGISAGEGGHIQAVQPLIDLLIVVQAGNDAVFQGFA